MSESANRVECRVHGAGIATYVCKHLCRGIACGYHAGNDPEKPDDRWPDAWCSACNEVLEREGDWTDASEGFADIQMLCNHCYDEARDRNARLPEPLTPDVGRLSPALTEAFEHTACAWLSDTQAKARDSLRFEAYGSWSWREEEGTFAFEDSKLGTLRARVRVAGTYSTKTNTWLWGWANEHIEDAVLPGVLGLKVFGEVRGVERLSRDKFDATLEDAWHVASMAAYLLGAELVYRVPMEHIYMFMLLDRFSREP